MLTAVPVAGGRIGQSGAEQDALSKWSDSDERNGLREKRICVLLFHSRLRIIRSSIAAARGRTGQIRPHPLANLPRGGVRESLKRLLFYTAQQQSKINLF